MAAKLFELYVTKNVYSAFVEHVLPILESRGKQDLIDALNKGMRETSKEIIILTPQDKKSLNAIASAINKADVNGVNARSFARMSRDISLFLRYGIEYESYKTLWKEEQDAKREAKEAKAKASKAKAKKAKVKA